MLVMTAPSASRPLRCRSIGLEPIAHPPGCGILALPLRASSGPMTRMDARILLTSSNCASVERMSFVVTARTFSSNSSISAPKEVRISFIKLTSRSLGTSRMTQVSSAKSAAAMSGSTAFFAPLITTSPLSGPLCCTIYLANVSSLRDYNFFISAKQSLQTFFPCTDTTSFAFPQKIQAGSYFLSMM